MLLLDSSDQMGQDHFFCTKYRDNSNISITGSFVRSNNFICESYLVRLKFFGYFKVISIV